MANMDLDLAKKCIIFGAGDPSDFVPQTEKGDLVIAADGGFYYTEENMIPVNLLIADFDSLHFHPEGVDIIELDGSSDDSDMFEAVKYGVGQRCGEFHIFGGTGKRIDHTLANIQSIAYLAQLGAKAFLYTKDSIVTCLHDNNAIAFDESYNGTVSVLSYSSASYDVNVSGLKNSLKNSMLSNIFPLGLSNEFIGEKSEISVGAGMLLVIFPFAKGAFAPPKEGEGKVMESAILADEVDGVQVIFSDSMDTGSFQDN